MDILYEEEKDLFDSSKMKNILGALSGWEFYIKGNYPNTIISSLHGWPGFPLYVEFEGRSIRCHEARLDFANSIFELDGTYKDTTECASYSGTLSYREKFLIKKLFRAYFLNNIVFQSQFLQKLKFSAYSDLSDYMKNGYLKF